MPRRSTLNNLPEEIRSELDRQLIAKGFADYHALAKWLADQGFEISKSSIQRYGSKFQAQLEALKIVTEQAKLISDHVGDDANTMADALTRLVQEKLFNIILSLE
jgi:phosphohistidine phosphatase SixA